mgnify:CR=1 FL=1
MTTGSRAGTGSCSTRFFVDERQARRYAALGIDVTTSMSFSWGKGDMFIERMGEHVLQDLIPLRRMLDAGCLVACGSDWGPKNVFEHVALGTTHEFCGSGRRNDGPAQAVTRAESLAMWTREAARVLQWEGRRHARRRQPRRPDRRRPRSADLSGRDLARDPRAADGPRRPDDPRRRRAVTAPTSKEAI